MTVVIVMVIVVEKMGVVYENSCEVRTVEVYEGRYSSEVGLCVCLYEQVWYLRIFL